VCNHIQTFFISVVNIVFLDNRPDVPQHFDILQVVVLVPT